MVTSTQCWQLHSKPSSVIICFSCIICSDNSLDFALQIYCFFPLLEFYLLQFPFFPPSILSCGALISLLVPELVPFQDLLCGCHPLTAFIALLCYLDDAFITKE